MSMARTDSEAQKLRSKLKTPSESQKLRFGFAFKNQNFNQQQVNSILQPKIVPPANC